ncbi:MAG: DivIVA domain-containing protein [Dermatophilaceae bacterium]
MLSLLIGVVVVAVAATVAAVSTGRVRADPLAEATRSTPDHGLPAVPTADDVDAVRFDTAPRGYRPYDVDARLDVLRATLADRELELARLQAEQPDHQAVDAAGSNAAGSSTAGSSTAGSNTAGSNAAGSNAAGSNSVGSNAAGSNAARTGSA